MSVVDSTKTDFELLAYQLADEAKTPCFLTVHNDSYKKGLFILRSPQCPYTEKNVNAMVETAESMILKLVVMESDGHESARRNPSPFGSFALIYNGTVLSHHPISNSRFKTIMASIT